MTESLKVRVREPRREGQEVVTRIGEDSLPLEHPARLLWEVLGLLDLGAFTAGAKAWLGPAGGSLKEATIRVDAAVFRLGNELQTFAATFYDRNRLPVGCPIAGPAIILQTDSTTVVPPDCSAVLEESGAIAIRLSLQ